MILLSVVLAVLVVSVLVGYLTTRGRRTRAVAPDTAATSVAHPHAEQSAPPHEEVAPPPPKAQPEILEVDAPQQEPDEATPSYRSRLGRSRGVFSSLRGRLGRRAIDASVLDDLEESLLGADVGVATTDQLLSMVRERAAAGELDDVDGLFGTLRAELLALLETRPDGGPVDRSLLSVAEDGRVPVWLFVGVNGVGKTTTIGKLAARESAAGRRVLLAAGDTFRAAAADQLGQWAERAGAEMVRGAEGADPSAVVFDALQRAGARHVDLVLADTAGRLHTKVNLIEELKKVRRVAERDPGQVTEVLLVLDATTGQNAVVQARQFSEAVGATGVVLTKLDGTARGGVVVAIQRELGLPVKLVGLGEGAGDLVDFDPAAFVDALLEP